MGIATVRRDATYVRTLFLNMLLSFDPERSTTWTRGNRRSEASGIRQKDRTW
jgi:hypothetical protein